MCLIGSLMGCGGGGGSSATTTPPAPVIAKAQGLFQGTTSAGTSLEGIVLDDGSFWGLYGTQSGNSLLINGFDTGQVTSSNNAFSMTYTDFPNPGGSSIQGSGSGTYTTTSLTGSITENGITQSFSLTSPQTTAYIYNTPAVISTVTGTWSGSLLDGETGTVTVMADGTFVGIASGGCAYSGTFAPRPSGVNVFNVILNFGTAPCLLPGQSATGIALSVSLGNGTNELIVAGTTSSPAVGTGFFAIR